MKELKEKYFWYKKETKRYWEKPLYLCLWNDPCALMKILGQPVYWLHHPTGSNLKEFDLVGVAADGTAVLAEIKSKLSGASMARKLAKKLEALKKASLLKKMPRKPTYWMLGRTAAEWRGLTCTVAVERCSRGDGQYPHAFWHLENYGKYFKKSADWDKVLKELEATPDDHCRDFNGKLAVFFVANEVNPKFPPMLTREIQQIVRGWARGRKILLSITLSTLGAESETGKPDPSVKCIVKESWDMM